MIERGLLQYRDDAQYDEYVDQVLTAEFYKYYLKSHKSTETLKIDISDNLVKDCDFHPGIFKINNVEETTLLSRSQIMYPYTEKEGKKGGSKK